MDPILFFAVFGLFIGCSLLLGLKGSRKKTNQEEYFLAGRRLPLLSLTLTLLATQVGGGMIIGSAEEAYSKGWWVLLYPLGMVIGLVTLGLGFGSRIRKMQISTIPEIFQKIYGSLTLRRLSAAVSVAALFFILVGQAIAAKKFFLSVGISSALPFILFWGTLVLYTVLGGVKAVIRTDILQVIFILGAFGAAFVFMLGGIHAPGIETSTLPIASAGDIPFVSWLVLPLAFMLIGQDMGQRCAAAKSPRTISLAATFAGVLLFFCALAPIYFGTFAAKTGLLIPEGSSVLLEAIQSAMPASLATLLMVAIFMAILSTADSLLCAIGFHLACDFPFKKKVQTGRALTFLVGMSSLVLAFLFDGIVPMLMFSYELALSLLFVPITMAIFSKRPSLAGANLSFCFGGFAFLLFRLIDPLLLPRELVILAIGYAGYFIGGRYAQTAPQSVL